MFMNDSNKVTKPNRIKVLLKDLPKSLTGPITDEIKDYSVPLLLNMQFIGSGTLIKCNRKHYVLTAHHVLKNQAWKANFNAGSQDEIGLAIATFPHKFSRRAEHLELIEIGVPK